MMVPSDTSPRLDGETDVAIVGAGILGLAHAAAALRRGLRVTVFERSDIAVGASIRNFGQMLVTGQPPGIMLDLARESRALYLGWAERAGLSVRANGCLLFARDAQEEAVLEEFMDTRAAAFGYRVRLLRGAALSGLYDGRFARHHAALQGTEDLQLYSREAVPALARWLAGQGVRFHFGTLVRHVEDGRLDTTAGPCRAQHVIVCSGHDYQTLCADQLRALQPQVCRLQMLRVAPLDGFALEHVVLTGLSCTHYGAFSDLTSARALATRIAQQRPELERHGIHLLVSPTPYGDWIVGDSHDYGQDARPFNAESVDTLMLDLAREALGSGLRVIERWQGVYGAKRRVPEGGAFSVTRVDARTTAALMHSGIGMSVGPALARRHVDALLDGSALPAWTPPARPGLHQAATAA
ncbi:FAD-dependent oxidoreductase [Cupriavidus sp. USMAHM13]|uniref:FAD-dependent oxidoreductase n=1 Tax=Cupriavidus malaysiensis TaxID=367825 RepID=A0ABM6F434_9BURK|nr:MULTISPECIES: TIGR03364 family FAD-dependent oxidoreductase [Cupriavidus]AOY99437.1 FAD-dependent oxidoreductase [Cupriavidus sp. USMAHM13]AOZ06054.1 FAD-dependent oxidoreductase [Cupriavidus malaysiensis]